MQMAIEAAEDKKKKSEQANAYVAKLLAMNKAKDRKKRIKQAIVLGLSLFSPENDELRAVLIDKLQSTKDRALFSDVEASVETM